MGWLVFILGGEHVFRKFYHAKVIQELYWVWGGREREGERERGG